MGRTSSGRTTGGSREDVSGSSMAVDTRVLLTRVGDMQEAILQRLEQHAQVQEERLQSRHEELRGLLRGAGEGMRQHPEMQRKQTGLAKQRTNLLNPDLQRQPTGGLQRQRTEHPELQRQPTGGALRRQSSGRSELPRQQTLPLENKPELLPRQWTVISFFNGEAARTAPAEDSSPSSRQPAQEGGAENADSVNRLTKKVYFHGYSPDSRLSTPARMLKRYFSMISSTFQQDLPAPSGRCSGVVCSRWFESLCSFVILANAAFIAWSTDYALDHLEQTHTTGMEVAELMFCIFYTVELVMRVSVHRIRYFCCTDWKWNVLDSVLVFTSVQEQVTQMASPSSTGKQSISFIRVMRIMKMTKLLRIVRLMRMFRELRLILHSVLGSLQAVFWALIMVVTILFMFGTFFVQGVTAHLQDGAPSLSAREELVLRGDWSSVLRSMMTLYQVCTNGRDWHEVVEPLRKVGLGYYLVFILYIGFYTCVVMNTLTSLFVETAMQNADRDQEHLIRVQLAHKDEYIRQLKKCFQTIDKHNTGLITYDDFCQHLKDPEVLAFVAMLEIELVDLQQFFAVLSNNGAQRVDLETFVIGCIKLKGVAKSMDMMDQCIRQRNAIEATRREQRRFEAACKTEFAALRTDLTIIADKTGVGPDVSVESLTTIAEKADIPRSVTNL
mmetsp:Transcript_40100/g.114614  ORF Transcript_40100/g.114614 Transcript_40100/m.114614 type:complete len:669 (+) Transcript_40100:3-2009(+)